MDCAFSADVQERLLKLSTSNISDALDRLGFPGGLPGIVAIGHPKKTVGPAFTVRYVPVGRVKPGTAGDYIDDVKPGEVVVIDNAGRTWCTVWGDILSMYAARRGIAGTVIDGVCRDVDGLAEYDYPVYARGHFMMTGKDRVEMDSVGQPVTVSNVLVRPGDIIVADASGVLVVPKEKLEEVLLAAEEIARAEEAIKEEVQRGCTLAEARKRYGYHYLQSARK